MTTLKDIEKSTNELLAKHFQIVIDNGLNTYSLSAKELGFSFKWDNAKRRIGCCKWSKRLITLSKHYCSLNLNRKEDLEQTIIHELAHVFTYHIYGTQVQGHGKEWKDIARQLGHSGHRTNQFNFNRPEKKWTVTCPKCESTRQKDRVRKGQACGYCCRDHNNGKYSSEFILLKIPNY